MGEKDYRWVRGGNQSTDTKMAVDLIQTAQRCLVEGDDVGALHYLKCALDLLPATEEATNG